GKPVVTETYFSTEIIEADRNTFERVIVSMESKSNHPLAQAIIEYYDTITPDEMEVENVIGIGLVGTLNGQTYKIGKPTSYHVIPTDIQQQTEQFEHEGKTVVYFRSEEHTSELQSRFDLVCRLL